MANKEATVQNTLATLACINRTLTKTQQNPTEFEIAVVFSLFFMVLININFIIITIMIIIIPP